MEDDGLISETMASARVGRLIVTVHGQDNPSDAEWSSYLEWVQGGDVPLAQVRTIVRSFGGGPNTLQRGELTEVMKGHDFRAKAVLLTSSLVVRGIGIALSWFNVGLRVMAPDQMDQAVEYLELDDAENAQARRLLEDLIARVEANSRDVGT